MPCRCPVDFTKIASTRVGDVPPTAISDNVDPFPVVEGLIIVVRNGTAQCSEGLP